MEIAAEVADSARSTIVEQVANGVSVRMAVLYLLLAGQDQCGGARVSFLIKTCPIVGGDAGRPPDDATA